MANVNTYMRDNFNGSQNTDQNAAGFWQHIADPWQGQNYNCFAHAVNVHNRAIVEQTRAQLEEAYSREGYFPVAATGAAQAGDAEIYTRPSEPNQIVHAHRVTGAGWASSKLGGGELINHRIGTLQVHKRNSTTAYEYGTVRYRYRYDAEKYNNTWEKTRSGRLRKRPATDDNGAAAKKSKTTAATGSRTTTGGSTSRTTTATKSAATKTTASRTTATKAPAPKTTSRSYR